MKCLPLLPAIAFVTMACGGTDKTGTPATPTAPSPATPSTAAVVVIDASARLASGFDLVLNTSQGRTDWLSPTSDGLQAAFPPGQSWGFIAAVLTGPSAFGSRPGRDLSSYKTLTLELRGANGGESVEVGIKDSGDPDDGLETKKAITLTASWQTFTFNLRDFSTADLTRVYLLFELVFNGGSGETVYIRNVQYLP